MASQGLVAAFSGKGILLAPPTGDGLLLAVAAGALSWIWFATKTGLPVSTTHALTGALVGAGLTAAGWSGINGSFLFTKFALPLAVGPLLAMAIIFLVYPIVRRSLTRWQGYCVCVQQPAVIAGDHSAALVATAPARLMLGETDECARTPVTIAGVTVADSLHWLSAGATAFARGFERGYRSIIAIGSDCPELDEACLKQAAGLLTKTDVVLGPATDGGYYLIGLRRPARHQIKPEPDESSHLPHPSAGLVVEVQVGWRCLADRRGPEPALERIVHGVPKM